MIRPPIEQKTDPRAAKQNFGNFEVLSAFHGRNFKAFADEFIEHDVIES